MTPVDSASTNVTTSLRVGVCGGARPATEGGGATLNAALVGALKSATNRHDFVFLDEVFATEKPPAGNPAPRLATRILRRGYRAIGKASAPDEKSAWLEQAVELHWIDIVWFMRPPGWPLSVPFIATVWDLEHRKQPYFPEVSVSGWTFADREAAYRAVLLRAAAIIVGTQTGKDEIVHYYNVNPANIRVIPFPAPRGDRRGDTNSLAALRDKFGFADPFVFYPAQFWPHKNHINLLLALDLLRKRDGLRPNLVLSGSDKGNRAYVREKVSELGLTDQVFDLGFVTAEEMSALYTHAQALVYPSFFGPDNLPPLEAFAFGCPVAAAKVAGAEEQLGAAALFFNPADPADIAAKLLAIISDAALRGRLTAAGAKIAASRTAEGYIAQVVELIDDFAAIRRCWGRDYRHT